MADAWGHDNYIALLQPVALGAHEILGTAGVAAIENLIERVAVQLHLGVGTAGVGMNICEPGFHFQFLIEIVRIVAKLPQKVLHLLSGRGLPLGKALYHGLKMG